MKKLLVASISASLMLAASFTAAEESLPLKAVNKANEVIDAALEAYGGAEAIAGLNSVARKSHFTTWATNQSRNPGPPWDENEQMNFSAIDFAQQTFVGKNKGSGNGFDFKTEGRWNLA